MSLNSLSIATGGYVCGDGPAPVAIATDGYVCLADIQEQFVPGGGSHVVVRRAPGEAISEQDMLDAVAAVALVMETYYD